MIPFINSLIKRIEMVYVVVSEYFKESRISTAFFIFIFLVFILNIIKRFFIWMEKKHGSIDQSCEYLIIGENEQDCDLNSRRKKFQMNGNSCEGCRGKSFKMTEDEAEKRSAQSNIWKYIIILLANYGKTVLPYISFLYTLFVAIFENNK